MTGNVFAGLACESSSWSQVVAQSLGSSTSKGANSATALVPLREQAQPNARFSKFQTFFTFIFNSGTFGTLWGFASGFSQKRAAARNEVNSEGFFLQLDRLGESARGGKRMRWWLQVRLDKRPWGEQNNSSEKYHSRKRWYMERNRCGRRYRSQATHYFFSSECLNLSQTKLDHNDGLKPSSDHLGRALELLSSC